MSKRKKLTDAEVLIQLARESLERYGTALPPTTERPARAPKHKISPQWKTVQTTCSQCGKEGMVDPDFGIRVARGVERKQSWCKECRAKTNYYNRPRVNHTPLGGPPTSLRRR